MFTGNYGNINFKMKITCSSNVGVKGLEPVSMLYSNAQK